MSYKYHPFPVSVAIADRNASNDSRKLRQGRNRTLKCRSPNGIPLLWTSYEEDPFPAVAAASVSLFCCCCSGDDVLAMSLEDLLGLSCAAGMAGGMARSTSEAAEVLEAAVSDLRFWLMRSACHMLFFRRRFSLPHARLL